MIGSGRKAGTPNKRTQDLIERFEELEMDLPEGVRTCIRELIALEDSEVVGFNDKLNVIRSKANIYLELMQYLYPKRKAIDHTGIPAPASPFDFSKLTADELMILDKALARNESQSNPDDRPQ